MSIDGASRCDAGAGQPRRPPRLPRALAVGAIALAAMALGPFTAGGTLARPSHLLIFTARMPMVPAADYHRCARGGAWVACSARGSHHVLRCMDARARHNNENCRSGHAPR
jgi:hypothetical protein